MILQQPVNFTKHQRRTWEEKVVSEKDPLKASGAQRRSFLARHMKIGRPRREYSLSQEPAFRYQCRRYLMAYFNYTEAVCSSKGYHDWKHATCSNKGHGKHAFKEHLICETMWKERTNCIMTGTKISTLLISDQLAWNRYYFPSILEMLRFYQ